MLSEPLHGFGFLTNHKHLDHAAIMKIRDIVEDTDVIDPQAILRPTLVL
jgi:hypothetical protein